jgi:hypothetical protein
MQPFIDNSDFIKHAETLNFIGVEYISMWERFSDIKYLKNAKKYFKEGTKILKDNGKENGLLMVEGNLAFVYYKLSDFEDEEENLRKAEEIYSRLVKWMDDHERSDYESHRKNLKKVKKRLHS